MNIVHLKTKVSGSTHGTQQNELQNADAKIHGAKIDGTNAQCCLDIGVACTKDGGDTFRAAHCAPPGWHSDGANGNQFVARNPLPGSYWTPARCSHNGAHQGGKGQN